MGSRGIPGGGGILKVGGTVRPLPITQGLKDWEIRNLKRNETVERGALFDANGNPLGAWLGDEHSTSIPHKILEAEGATFTHNHPNDKFGGTFSFTDLKTFADSKWKEIRATSEQGQLYSLIAGPNADKAKLKSWVKSRENIIDRAAKSAYDKALKSATTPLKSGPHKGEVKIGSKATGYTYRQPMTPAQADKYARQFAVGILDRSYEKNLKRFGFNYIATKAGQNA